ncbi:MAG: gamma-glutamyl-gamma-aminobutyrate hydrolase family protein [Salinisphaera sp.]|uniref:gamma-glutamyl-gamma-aminobutyrate hydrolase family protein n=1 Tax=Salinisphaera sp. TaxID=1914330 RepID=UPI003C7C7B82
MRQPLIGLTTYGCNDRGRHELPAEYSESVVRAGAVPVLLPPVGGRELAESWLERLDGVILTGGGDLDPALYGGHEHPTVYNLDPARDTAEMAVARAALERSLPILAICRGLQVVNTVLGGTLYEDLPAEFESAVAHRVIPHTPTRHGVRVEPGTRLASILGASETESVSWHHQGIRSLGEGLKPIAHADDGLIEAAELPAHPWCIGVQWHPELSAAEDRAQQRLFDAFVEQARLG